MSFKGYLFSYTTINVTIVDGKLLTKEVVRDKTLEVYIKE